MMEVHFDVSQIFVIAFSIIGSIVVSIVGYKVTQYFKKQDKAAESRERKQDLHFKKMDATIYSIGIVLEPEKAQLFKTSFEHQMAEYYAEKNLINQP